MSYTLLFYDESFSRNLLELNLTVKNAYCCYKYTSFPSVGMAFTKLANGGKLHLNIHLKSEPQLHVRH
jgi:hypothetical protein